MSNVTYLNDLMLRLCEVEKEAMANIGYTIDVYPYFGIKAPTSPPFWVNRLGALTASELDGRNLLIQPLQIFPRLVIAHATEDYDGEIFTRAYDMISRFETWLLKNDMLKSVAYPNEPDYLVDGVTYVGHSGLIFFTYAGIQQAQLGVEFTVELRVVRPIE
jgi:hypothetical protein